MVEGLTGAPIHSGSWFGLPDLGVTEWIGGLQGAGTTPQGGSDLIPNVPVSSPVNVPSNLPINNNTLYSSPAGPTYSGPVNTGSTSNTGNTGNTGGTNMDTTYFTINGETKKGSDWLSQGVNPLNPGGGGPSQADLQAEVDAQFNPAFAYLSDLEAQYQREYPTAQQAIENSYGQITPLIQQEQATKLGGLQEQRVKGKAQEKSQFASARDRYNELKQGLLTRFGGSSSTGEATQELLGRTANQEMGQISQNFGQLYTDIGKEETQTKTFYANKLTELEKEKQNKLQELNNDLQTKLAQIRTKRGELESNKSVARLQILREYSAQARQIQYDTQQMQQKLALWMQMKDQALQLAKDYQAKSFTIPGIPGLVNSFTVNRGATPGIQGEGIYGYPSEEELARMGYFGYGNTIKPIGDTVDENGAFNWNS